MTALDRLIGRAFGRAIRRPPPARLAIPALAAALAIVGAAVVLLPPSGAPGAVAVGATPELSAGVPTPTPRYDFWGELFSVRDGLAYWSLTDLGERSEAVVVGFFTGEVEPGREACDEETLAAGAPREQACVSFANLPFRIDDVLAGWLPEQYVESVRLEYQVDPGLQAALAEVVPTDARLVLFIGGASNEVRSLGWDVYYAVGRGTFREVDGRVVPIGWPDDMPDDPEFGRLDGMPFERFIELVRGVSILDLTPES